MSTAPTETAEIIQLSAFARKPRATNIPKNIPEGFVSGIKTTREERIAERMARQAARDAENPPSDTCRNKRLRDQLWDTWRRARSTANYWHARMKWNDALSCAQRDGIGDSASFPSEDYAGTHMDLVRAWRQAIVLQLLAPAPDAASIAWKKTYLRNGELDYLAIEHNQLERIIANDIAFIAAHPVRTTKAKKQ